MHEAHLFFVVQKRLSTAVGGRVGARVVCVCVCVRVHVGVRVPFPVGAFAGVEWASWCSGVRGP